MAYVTTLSQGPNYTLTQNVVYALPPSASVIFAANACEFCPTVDGTFVAIAASATTGVNPGAGFIRCTTGNTTVSIRKA